MINMIRDLEGQILDQIINEGKDPVDATIKEKVAEWKELQKQMAVVKKISDAITKRVGDLESGFEELIKGIEGNKTVVDGAILEYTKKKSRTTVKYKESVDYALKMMNEAQQKVLKEFIESVTSGGEMTNVLNIVDPELEQYLLQLKDISGEDLKNKIQTMARSSFDKLPRQIANAKKRELKEGVANNLAKVVKNLVRTFKTKFKAVFKAIAGANKAAEALAKAVKADPLKESVVTEDQNYTDYGQWQSACKQGRDNVWFDGDEKECSAYSGEQPFTQGQTVLVGSWNGQSGTAKAPAQQNESQVEVGWYVEDAKGRNVAGPFKSESEAKTKAKQMGGEEKGFDTCYISDYAARRMNEELIQERESNGLHLDLKKGAFHKWLGIPQDQKLTMADIKKGLKSDDEHVRKMAEFAKNSREWVHESLMTEAASDWTRLEKLKTEFREIGDQIDDMVKNGEEVTHDHKLMKKALRIRDQLGKLNKKLGIPRPGDIKPEVK